MGCAAAWYVFSFGVSIYIDYFHGFSLYGSLTTIVLIMFWLYFAMYIFLVCGEVNNAIEMILIELKLDFRMRKKKMRKKAEKLEQKRTKQESKQSESGQQGSKKQADEKQGKR